MRPHFQTVTHSRICCRNWAFPFQRFTSRQTLLSPSQLEPQPESEGGAGHRPRAAAHLRGTAVWVFLEVAGIWCDLPPCVLLSPHGCPSQLVNNGPSAFSQATLEVRCPLRAQGQPLLYPLEVVTEGPLSCSSKHLNTMKLKVRTLAHANRTVRRDTSVHVTVDVSTSAAPSCSSRWSNVTEIQQ